MTDEEQRIAIAEAVGWRFHPDGYGFIQPGGNDWIGRGYRTLSECCPDYLNDLNAIHAAEEMLHPNECEHFAFTLQNIVGQFWYNEGKSTINFSQEAWLYATAHATARQRSEAYLRTLGLWK